MTMTASSERILLQIIDLEIKLQEDTTLGKDTTMLEEQISVLRKDLNNLTEGLTRPGAVLKG
jgi:hypothetical protein